MDFSVLVLRRSYQSRRPGQGRRAGPLERQIPKPRGTAILVVGPAGILPADNHPLKDNAATKSFRLGPRPGSRRPSNEGICSADKHVFLSLNQHVKSLDDLPIRARLHIFEAMQLTCRALAKKASQTIPFDVINSAWRSNLMPLHSN